MDGGGNLCADISEYATHVVEKTANELHAMLKLTCHWRRNCPTYLTELLKKKQYGSKSYTSDLLSGVVEPLVGLGMLSSLEVVILIDQVTSHKIQKSIASGSLEDLEIIQEEDTNPSLDTSLNYEEDDQEIDEPQSDINPIYNAVWVLVELPLALKTVGNAMALQENDFEHGCVVTFPLSLFVANGPSLKPIWGWL
ncbi:hypothetical protein Tco_0123617 [Tanacetum coccineum]